MAVLAGAARLHGSPLLAHFLPPFSRALAPPCPRKPRARLPVPCRGRSRHTVDKPRHRSAMRAIELHSELLPCLLLVHRVRLVAGELLVVTAPSASSPSARAGRSAPPLFWSDRQVGAVDPWGPTCQRPNSGLGAQHRVHPAFSSADF